jgi:hypothetical protein
MRRITHANSLQSFLACQRSRLPWTHHCLLLDKLSSSQDRLWYAAKALENGWSRPILALQIESGLHTRQGKALTNFKATLPPPQSDLAQQITKDPYVFDFLDLRDAANERAVEDALMAHVEKFLLDKTVGKIRKVRAENPKRDPKKPCVYVGMTGLTPEVSRPRWRGKSVLPLFWLAGLQLLEHGAKPFLGILGRVYHHREKQRHQQQQQGRAPPVMGTEPFHVGRIGQQTQRRRQRGRTAFLCACFPDAGDFSVSAVSSSPSPVLAPAKDMSL